MTCEHVYGQPYCPLCGVRLHTNERPIFPLKAVVYLHSDKETLFNKGKELGLSDEAIENNFMYCLYELKINIEVNEDGTYKIISCEE